MVSLVARTTGAVVALMFLSSPSTAFFASPMGASPSSRDIRDAGSRTRATAATARPFCSSRTGRRHEAYRRGASPAGWRGPRTYIVLQAATDGGEQQLSESDTLEAQQGAGAAAAAAARSKQLNIACNDVVRTILDGNVSTEKARALALRQRLEAQKDEIVNPEDDMSALFFDNLLLVCQHELHPDLGVLRGEYGKAWHTILHYIEDAGWQLTDPPFSISG